MDYEALAQLLFPGVSKTPEDLEHQYPPRMLPEGAKVTRMAPSPTGFMHLGNLYGALTDERLAHQSGGVFFLRIEDTDQKRAVEGGVETILEVFARYALPFDEGATLEGDNGAYGPYRQRQRAESYHVCAKSLVRRGLAYPCFLTEQELGDMRETQAAQKLNFGCYGEFARYRDASLEEVKRLIEEGKPYVIRLRSGGNLETRVKTGDLVRGVLEFPENDQDVVLLKADGIPTYHFAHVVDDHLMRTTHVVRGEEWLATLPIHVQLFSVMGWKPPKYLHTAQLMKLDGGSKRKLSKRKDPELALDYYNETGYPVAAVKEYLLSLLNSNFEDWRLANPEKDMNEFPFSIKKMGVSGALFDTAKLDDVSRGVISRMEAGEVYAQVEAWASRYDEEFHRFFTRDEEYTQKALSIGRTGPKRRKDITVWSEVKAYLGFIYDELFAPEYQYPQNISQAQIKEILQKYAGLYSAEDESGAWFEKIKALAASIGFAADTREYKKTPEAFGGHVGDVSMVLRVAVSGRQQSPDMQEVMKILGEERVRRRLQQAESAL